MGEASEQQKAELYKRFFPSASETEAVVFVERHGRAATMAEFQGLLLGLEQDCSASSVVRPHYSYENANTQRITEKVS